MKQNIFEIRERTQELMEQAIAMWRQSSQSEYLEGLEKDPVFSMLMSAIAYQNNETENEIARIKDEVVREFVQTIAPYEMAHPIPATIAIKTHLESGTSEWEVDSDTLGRIGNNSFTFMPLMRTRVLNAEIGSIIRLDGRRWKVKLNFEDPISDLSRFCFGIRNSYFEDVRVSCGKYQIPLIRPWEYSKLPMTRCLSLDCALYNNSQYFNASTLGMELFSRQNVRLFCIKDHNSSAYMPEEAESIELHFEFTGITDDFTFDYDQLMLNCMIMVEAQQKTATLSAERPVVRLAGYSNDSEKMNSDQFLHLVRPSEDQLFNDLDIQIRRVSADRFNQASLTRLLSSLINKYHSDFYAFQQVRDLTNDHTIEDLQDILSHMLSVSKRLGGGVSSGVYAMLSKEDLKLKEGLSVDLPYLTTHGATVNDLLTEDLRIALPSGFDNSSTELIAPPVPGSDEISDQETEDSLLRYRIVTNNRIVTPADIKLFCYTTLQTRYGIDNKMVDSIEVAPRRTGDDYKGTGYEILAEIVLKENNFVRRSFANKASYVELMLQKMMEVRSAGIYPIRVSIQIKEPKP